MKGWGRSRQKCAVSTMLLRLPASPATSRTHLQAPLPQIRTRTLGRALPEGRWMRIGWARKAGHMEGVGGRQAVVIPEGRGGSPARMPTRRCQSRSPEMEPAAVGRCEGDGQGAHSARRNTRSSRPMGELLQAGLYGHKTKVLGRANDSIDDSRNGWARLSAFIQALGNGYMGASGLRWTRE